jgi:hypothetical protein
MLLVMLMAIPITCLRMKDWRIESHTLYEIFAPAGRCLLLIMYFYGIFHKLNTDFLNPEISCATELWVRAPIPELLKGALWAHYSAIYGTLIIEAAIMLALIGNIGRYYAVLTGLTFHYFIGFNDFAGYVPFSAVSFGLHFLFLPASTLDKFQASRLYQWVSTSWHPYAASVFWLLFLGAWVYIGLTPTGIDKASIWGIMGVGIIFFVACYGKQEENTPINPLSSHLALNIFVLLFFINGALPYVGLKTAQTISMFSNLHTEGGRTNHILFDTPPYLFDYQRDLVKIIASTDPFFARKAKQGYHFVYYDFLYEWEQRPSARISYERYGLVNQRYEHMHIRQTYQDRERLLLPDWLNYWFNFYYVVPNQPKYCENSLGKKMR